MSKSDIEKFMTNQLDFGTLPWEGEPATDEQRRIIALAMATNAAVVQFILEGLFPQDQLMHFMQHLQDFAARLYGGESIKMPETHQTLQINSKAGSLFLDATANAVVNGHTNFTKFKEMAKEMVAKQEAEASEYPETMEQNNVSTKPTLH